MADTLPVTVMKRSPTFAASLIGMTLYPSITASRAFLGSTSPPPTLPPTPPPRGRPPPPPPAVSCHHNGLACKKDIGRVHDPVDRTLSGPVSVVKHHLCLCIVHCDHGIFQCSFSCHGAKPDHACGGLLTSAFYVFDQFQML